MKFAVVVPAVRGAFAVTTLRQDSNISKCTKMHCIWQMYFFQYAHLCPVLLGQSEWLCLVAKPSADHHQAT